MSLQCRCGSRDIYQCSSKTITSTDDMSEKFWLMQHRTSLAPASVLLHLGTWGFKLAMTKAYRCRTCNYSWRRWPSPF